VLPRDTGRILHHRRIKEYPAIAYRPHIGLYFSPNVQSFILLAPIFSQFALHRSNTAHSYCLNTSVSLISTIKVISPGRVTVIHHELRSDSEVSAGDTTGEFLHDL
jgi:hypothetical protein